MFDGNGVADFDFHLERVLLSSCLHIDDQSLLVADVILRLTFHWNIEICEMAYTSLAQKGFYVSPVVYTALLCSCRSFDIFCEDLPKHVRQNLVRSSDDTYFAKYESGFGEASRCFLVCKYHSHHISLCLPSSIILYKRRNVDHTHV